MGARTGAEYLAGLRDGREVWIGGERVPDVTAHPGLARGARSLARLMDRQHEPGTAEVLTAISPTTGDRIPASHLRPTTAAELSHREAAMLDWARATAGMMGRSPDYLNSSLMAMGAAASYFAAVRPEFGANIAVYAEHAREHDLVLTHTLLNPTVSRHQAEQGRQAEDVALRRVGETGSGIVVRGARLLATLGPLSDELLVFPSTVRKGDLDDHRFALGFAVASDAPGLKYLCRDSYDTGKSVFDAPLSSRYEEMDCLVVFDDVVVPWDRVFLLDDQAAANDAFAATGAVVHMMHQVACKNLAKAEFIVGLLCAMTASAERDSSPAVQGQIAEAMIYAETMRACLRASMADAAPDQWGTFSPARLPLDTARNVFPKMYPRLVEIVQLLGSSSLMATPSEADFTAGIGPDIRQYLQAATLNARDRVALFRLAQDVAVSGFGARQALYERFFFGPPEAMASVYFARYDKLPLVERVWDLLRQQD
jgi:4-hydroxyphenylacetate 3-monooxygenase